MWHHAKNLSSDVVITSSSNLIRAFDLVGAVGALAFNIFLTRTIWWDREGLLDLIEQTKVEYSDIKKKRQRQCVAVLICLASEVLALFANLYEVLSVMQKNFHLKEWNHLFTSPVTFLDLVHLFLITLSVSLTCYGMSLISMIGLSLVGMEKRFSKILDKTGNIEEVHKLLV